MNHVLVVEDEEHLAQLIRYNLEAEGYHVTCAADGPSALAIMEHDPDDVELVILDLMLPGMSGYTVCETLRAAGRDVPILILSARTLAEDRTRGFDVGADQYLMKPFELEELLSRVKGLLTRYSGEARQARRVPERPTTFAFGEGAINFETFEVTVRGEAVRLTPLEIRLLEYFVENEGRVIPRQELLENVWSRSGNLHTRSVDQFVRRLRVIFEPDPARPRYFLTIRDAGYRFVAAGEESGS